jgi:hypothetical protein
MRGGPAQTTKKAQRHGLLVFSEQLTFFWLEADQTDAVVLLILKPSFSYGCLATVLEERPTPVYLSISD